MLSLLARSSLPGSTREQGAPASSPRCCRALSGQSPPSGALTPRFACVGAAGGSLPSLLGIATQCFGVTCWDEALCLSGSMAGRLRSRGLWGQLPFLHQALGLVLAKQETGALPCCVCTSVSLPYLPVCPFQPSTATWLLPPGHGTCGTPGQQHSCCSHGNGEVLFPSLAQGWGRKAPVGSVWPGPRYRRQKCSH